MTRRTKQSSNTWLVTFFALLTAALMMISACAAPAAEAPAAEAPAAEAPAAEAPAATSGDIITIRGLANESFSRAWQDRLVPEFERLYPNIKVQIDGVPYGDILPKSMLELTAPEVIYDFIITDDPWTPQMAEAGLLEPLTNFEGFNSAEYDVADFNPAPLAAGEWDGVQYGVPVRSNILLMFYNRTLFEEAGLNADEALTDINWEEFEALLAKLMRDTDGDGKTDVWALGNDFERNALTFTRWQAMLNSNGGKVLDEGLKPVFNTPEGAAAVQKTLNWLQYGPPGIEAMTFNQMNEAFRNSKIAMMLNWGSVYRANAVDPATTTLTPEQVGVSPLPAGSLCDASSHRGVYVGVVPSGSSHKAEGWQFLEWLSSKEGEQFNSREVGSFPARVSTLQGTPPEAWQGPVFKAIQDSFDAIECGEMWRPRLPDSDAVSQILGLHYSRAVLGEVTPEVALNDAAAEIEQFLQEEGYYD